MDLAMHPADMAMSPAADLSTPPDLAPATIPVPAGCNTNTVVTGTVMYTTLSANKRCMGGACHNSGQNPAFSTQATFMSAMVGKQSTSSLNYVTANQPDKSYLLFKLRNLQLNVPGGSGGQMPEGGTPLTDTEFCTVYDWVLHGAPTQ
jgi:hypothetical protein